MQKFSFNIKKTSIGLVIGLVFLFSFSQVFTQSAQAGIGINRTINFQGKLVNNPASTNVSDTSYTVVFTFYDNASGGTQLWQESQTVTTSGGIFRVALGSVTPFPANFNFNWSGLYLGIKVNSDSEMTPRVQMTAVPFAFNAEKVAGLTVQDTSGNASTSGTLQIANAKTVSFADAFTTSGAFPLTLTTTASTNITLPTTGTLLSNTASANQTITSTQTTGTVLGVADSTGLTGSITGFNVALTSATNSQNKSGIAFDLSGGTGGTYYDLQGSGSTWAITRAGAFYANGSYGSAGDCLKSGGGATSAMTFGSCGTAGGVNWWNQLAGALSPVSVNDDFLIGGTATSAAKFSYTGIQSGETIASVSGNLIIMPNNGWGGQLGIGTTTITPGFNLSVTGQGIFGNNQAVQYGGNKLIYLNNKTTDIASDNFTIAGSLEANPSGDTSKIYYGGFFSSQSTSGNVQNFTGRLVGFQGQVTHNGTGTLGTARGFAGFITNASSGTITDSFAGRFGNTNSSTGQITNAYGVYIVSGANTAGGAFLNNYGLYLEDQSKAGSTANYNIYSAGGGSHNYFAGNLGIGTTDVGNGQLVVNQTNFAGSSGDIFAASASGTTKFVIAQSGTVTIGNSTDGLVFNPTSAGPIYSGTARPTKRITLSPEYPGAVLTASGSAATTGSMTSDASSSAALSNWRTYYEWSSSTASPLQDYTVVVRVKLPEDFSAWATTDALTISYNTELPGVNDNKLDVIIYNADTSLSATNQSTPVVMRTANVSTSAKTWLDLSIDDSDLIDNGNALDAAGDIAVIYLKMYSQNNNHVQIGDIKLSYLSKF